LEPDSQAAQVQFELEQFEVIDGDRCEVRGRWLGVRGRRFLRPTLTITVDGRSRRLLADLAGKPWAVEEGGPWQASFPSAPAGAELDTAELTVAPDLSVALQSRRPTRSQPARGPVPAARGPVPPTGPAPPTAHESPARATPSPLERPSRADPGERLRRELVDARTEQRRLQSQVDHLRLQKADMTRRNEELIVQTGEVTGDLDAVTRARERLAAELQEQRAKMDRLGATHDEALLQLDEMTAKRDAARYDYGEVVRRLEATEAAHQRTLAERDRAIGDRDAASAAPDRPIARSDELARRTASRRPASRPGSASFPRSGLALVLFGVTLLVAVIVSHL
jgi:hypothetical protein